MTIEEGILSGVRDLVHGRLLSEGGMEGGKRDRGRSIMMVCLQLREDRAMGWL